MDEGTREIFGGRSPQEVVAAGDLAGQRQIPEGLLPVDGGVYFLALDDDLPDAPFRARGERNLRSRSRLYARVFLVCIIYGP